MNVGRWRRESMQERIRRWDERFLERAPVHKKLAVLGGLGFGAVLSFVAQLAADMGLGGSGLILGLVAAVVFAAAGWGVIDIRERSARQRREGRWDRPRDGEHG